MYLQKAKAHLILTQPFFATLLLHMSIVEDQGVATLCTDGETIRYNPQFLATLSLEQTVFVLAHETMHCVFQHMHRRGQRDPKRWNIAADYVINELLYNEGVGSMPSGVLYNPQLVTDGHGTTEGVYDLLPNEPEGKGGPDKDGNYPGAGDEGGALDHVSDAGQDEATLAEKEAETRVRVTQAANAARMMGKLSAGIERLTREYTQSRTDWRAVLRRFLTERSKVDYTFAKPKRRFLAEDIYLPGLTGEEMGEVVIAVDCSGSVSPTMLELFGGEIKAICEDVKPRRIHILYFDTEILRADTFEADQEIEIKPVGGGGTSFVPIFDHIDSMDADPAAVVVLTDLCGTFPKEAPSYPVLWASTYVGDKAPFGETLYIRE